VISCSDLDLLEDCRLETNRWERERNNRRIWRGCHWCDFHWPLHILLFLSGYAYFHRNISVV